MGLDVRPYTAKLCSVKYAGIPERLSPFVAAQCNTSMVSTQVPMLTHDAPHALTLRDIVINRSLDLGEAPLDIVAPTTGSCNTHQTGKYIERFIDSSSNQGWLQSSSHNPHAS